MKKRSLTIELDDATASALERFVRDLKIEGYEQQFALAALKYLLPDSVAGPAIVEYMVFKSEAEARRAGTRALARLTEHGKLCAETSCNSQMSMAYEGGELLLDAMDIGWDDEAETDT